jgi:putative heme-binding domain-containing protein
VYHGGNSFRKFIERIKEQALAKVPDAERARFAEIAAKQTVPVAAQPAVVRSFQKAWTMADLEADLPRAASGRNFARGREIFASVQCATCHLFNGGGGNVGPDLTAVAQRFQRRDILEAIVDPSKVISEQYASYVFTLNNGETYVGQVANESNYHYDVIIDPVRGERRQVGKTSLKSKAINPVSLMPPGLINVLTKDEVLDLLAYIESSGNEKAKAFSK